MLRSCCCGALLAALAFSVPVDAQLGPESASTAAGPDRSLLVAGAVAPVDSDPAAAEAASMRGVVYSVVWAGIGTLVAIPVAAELCGGDRDPPAAATCMLPWVGFGFAAGAVYGWHLGVSRSRSGSSIYATFRF